ncbi:E3 SUMO-protein ligase pias1 [Dermatophagoides pteronyssinus]|uniref:E3 SUMO-protein ligase pias1 n=1 Tax=Dermatophagoides pteronyssinus TaxID=6956 RepID=A0ABQ8JLF7_DERPT|nr:E3 SUMO-protein ligase pias1 [Dermatophagoides pteronyssinus]
MNVRFIKHNSYEEIRSLIKPQRISKDSLGESTRQSFRSTMVTTLTMSDQYKVFLRFCKYSTQLNEQMDCLPKSFNLSINECTFTIKNKYTFAPYDITQRIVGEKNNEIYIRATIPEHNDFSNTDYYYGVFLMKKIDHKNLLKLLKDKGPHDTKLSIDLVKKKLFTDDDDVICDNVMKVSLLCPLTSLRLKIPSRSKHCDHVHCFDGEAFISINDITPRWKCPICKIYIKFDDLIIDGLVSRILKNAPTESNEAQIFPDGTFEYLQNGVKINNPNISEGRPTTNLKRNSSSLCLKNEDKKPRLDSTLKAPKKPTIEWITIDSSDDDDNNKDDDDDDDDDDDSDKNSSSDNSDASSSATIISQTDYSNYPRINSSNSSNDCKNNNDDNDSDDDCMIVFEKINPQTTTTTTTRNIGNHNHHHHYNPRNSRSSNHSSRQSGGGGRNASDNSTTKISPTIVSLNSSTMLNAINKMKNSVLNTSSSSSSQSITSGYQSTATEHSGATTFQSTTSAADLFLSSSNDPSNISSTDPYHWLFNDITTNPLSLAFGNDLSPFIRSTSASSSASSSTVKEPQPPQTPTTTTTTTNFQFQSISISSSSNSSTTSNSTANIPSKYSLLQPR